jgi:hypothetical protein
LHLARDKEEEPKGRNEKRDPKGPYESVMSSKQGRAIPQMFHFSSWLNNDERFG